MNAEQEWLEFPLTPGERAAYEVTRAVYRGRTKLQAVEIVETRAHGLALFLDGVPQSASGDEFIYHEALVHPALVAHPDPRRVLIAGGGEGSTLREVLRHPSVEQVTMVDIDGELISLARQHLHLMHQGSFDDPRAEVIIEDALTHLRDTERRYDAIVIDLTDPTEEGPVRRLYSEEFYRLAASRLSEGGVLATQASSFAINNLGWWLRIAHNLARVFSIVRSYRAEVPSFKDSWAFCTASPSCDPVALTPSAVETRRKQRALESLRFYDGESHASMFALPRYAREALTALDKKP